MDQSKREFMLELSIFDQSENQIGGYLKYIQSKYPKITMEEKSQLKNEWQLEYEEALAINSGNHETKNFSPVNSTAKTDKDIFINSADEETKTSEFILPSHIISGGSLNCPNTTLFDNFVTDDSDNLGIDYGSYIPSGLTSSCNSSRGLFDQSSVTVHDLNHIERDEVGNFPSSSSVNDRKSSFRKSIMTRGCLLPIETMNVRSIYTLIFYAFLLFLSHFIFLFFIGNTISVIAENNCDGSISISSENMHRCRHILKFVHSTDFFCANPRY